MTRKLPLQIIAFVVTLGVCFPATYAQDAAVVDSVHYRVAFENDAVRVLRVRYGPGERSVMHTHPAGVLVFLTDGEGTFTSPDGSTQTFRWRAGESEWVPAMAHLPENTGEEAYELLFVEVKDSAAAAPDPETPAHEGRRLPIIDMHLHANSPDGFGGPQTVCTNRDAVEFPPVDPREEATVQKTATCAHPLMSSRSGEENARRTGEMMERYNVYGVLDVSRAVGGLEASLAHGDEWRRFAPGRYWTAVDFSDAGLPPLDQLEALVREGRVQLFAEVSPQYDGEKPTAERLAPYFALAERLDVPVGLHLGEGPPGGAHVMPGSGYSPAAGRPLDLDPLLRRHPELRLYVMHYGSPLVEEMIALLYSHPNVYVDVAQNNWGFPRAHFYRQLQQLVEAGFGKRIMFGSDQMIWPDTIPVAIETIDRAPFLTEEQKRDILYHNAARFLRLTEGEIARHHGRTRATD